MNNDQPLVTVYIPTFNRLELLQRAVQSVQNQTYQKLEIIIVDDCSTDGTQEYLAQLANEDSRVRYFLKEKNSGACVSRNIAIENAVGEFITGLDDDDYFDQNRIENFVKNSNKIQGDCVGLCSLYALHYDSGVCKSSKFLKNKIITRKHLFVSNEIGNQIFTKTEILTNVLGFNEELACLQDLDCWIRVLSNGYIYRLFEYTYYVDCEHDSKRISDNKIGKYLNSIDIITNENKLTKKENRYLLAQIFNKVNGLNFYFNYLTIFRYPSFNFFKYFILKIFKYMLKK